MKKSLIALAVAGAMTVPAIASADATLYGSFRMHMDVAEGNSATLRDYSSRVGIRGTVDLGLEDTKGLFLWESALNMNSSKESLGNLRYAHVGATGSWGTALAGKLDHPTHTLVSNVTDLQASGRTPSSVSKVGYTDEKVGNTLAYVTPDYNGFQAIVGGVFAGEGLSSDLDADQKDKTIDGYNLGARYNFSDIGLSLRAAYGAIKADKQTSGEYELDARKWGVAAVYNWEALTLAAKYEHVKDKTAVVNDKEKSYGLGARYEVNGMGAALMYNTTKEDNADRIRETNVEVYNKMGNGVVAAGYTDYNSAAQTGAAGSNINPDVFYVAYRLNF